jgi:hypothetical protein
MRARSRQATRGVARVVLALAAVGAFRALPGSAGAPPGQLGYDGCIADNVAGCTDLASDLLAAATGVAASPDGGSVYVARRARRHRRAAAASSARAGVPPSSAPRGPRRSGAPRERT